MDEFKELISEIQVDWDTTLHSNFNPLKLSLKILGNSKMQKDFIETFHRLSSVMDKVIKSNFEAFSDSFKSFEVLNFKNKEIIQKYDQITSILDNIPYLQETLDMVSLTLSQDSEFKEIYEICSEIIESRNLYREFCFIKDHSRKSKLIVKSLEILRKEQYSQIKGVFEFYKIVYKSYLEYCNYIHSVLLDFVIENNNSNFQFYPIVIELRSIAEFNEYCADHFHQRVFDQIENVISETIKANDCTIETVCEEVAEAVEKILSNMWILVERFTQLCDSEERDYFGKFQSKRGYIYEIKKSIATIQEILLKFIDLYSYEIELDKPFDMSYISHNIDFSKAYDSDLPIYKRLISSNIETSSCNRFTVLKGTTTQIAKILLSFIKTPELRIFLEEIVQSKKYTGSFLDGKKEEIKMIFSSFDINSNDIDKFESLVIDSLICLGSSESAVELKNYLNTEILIEFVKIHDQIFKSELVKKPYFSNFLESIQTHTLSLKVENLIFSNDELKNNIVSHPINKKTLFINSKKYKIVERILESLKRIENEMNSEQIKFLIELYNTSLKRQCMVDFFYFYDLLYRQGNYQYYLRLCVEVFDEIKQFEILEDLEKCFDFYNKMNVHLIKCKSHNNLEEHLSFLRILYEIVGPEFNILKTIEFFDNVLKKKATDKQSKILVNKIS